MNTDKLMAESIAKEYIPKENSKVIALKKLDRRAKMPATVLAYFVGTLFVLVFGLGMCLAMQVIGNGTTSIVLGIIVGIIGLFVCSVNYPVYKKVLKKCKAKYSYDIIRLAKEIADN